MQKESEHLCNGYVNTLWCALIGVAPPLTHWLVGSMYVGGCDSTHASVSILLVKMFVDPLPTMLCVLCVCNVCVMHEIYKDPYIFDPLPYPRRVAMKGFASSKLPSSKMLYEMSLLPSQAKFCRCADKASPAATSE